MSWRVENHVFIGQVLVDEPYVEDKGAGRTSNKVRDGWLPFAIDLRTIFSIRPPAGDKLDRCSLCDEASEFVAAVNATFDELLPHFLASRPVEVVNPPSVWVAEPPSPDPFYVFSRKSTEP